MAKRLLFIDVTKGLAILGVILVHVLINGVWFYPSNALDVLPLWVLGILSPLVLVATWAGFFELLSGLSNMYNMYDRMVVRKQSFKKAAQGPLVNSTGLLLIHFIFVTFFSHRRNAPYPRVYDSEINTIISGSLELGRFHVTDFQFFFFADVLGSIALAGYLSVFIIWALYRLDYLQDVRKSIVFLTFCTIAFFAISYPIWDVGYELVQDLLIERSFVSLTLALPLSMLVGAFQPFFPIAGYGILGVTLGLIIAAQYHREEDPAAYEGQSFPSINSYLKWSALFSLVSSIVLIAMYIMRGGNPLGILEYYRIPPELLTFNIAFMLWAILAGIKVFEEPDMETRIRRAKQTTFIRRFGMVTLSVYVAESVVNGLASFIFHQIFDDPNTPEYESHVAAIPIFGYVIVVFAFWFIVVRLWERIGFIYGIEWMIIKWGSRFRSSKSKKLDMTFILYDPLGLKRKSVLPEGEEESKTFTSPTEKELEIEKTG